MTNLIIDVRVEFVLVRHKYFLLRDKSSDFGPCVNDRNDTTDYPPKLDMKIPSSQELGITDLS